jgi:imidazolonepropionase-like amidohydrolase
MARAATHGAVDAGKPADLVLLNDKPKQDIEATQRIDAVILRGEFHQRAELDAMLHDVEARVARQRAAR